MKKIFTFLVILLGIPTILPLFRTGLFPVHDATQVARVFTMGKALADGMLPVRMVDYLGYNLGYPIFNFYGPLSYYFGGLFTLFGFSALVSTKLMIGVGMLLAGVSMYLLVSTIFGKKAGLTASILYLYAPYHALDLYVRGAVGELWAYALLPLIFYGLWNIYQTGKFRFVVITSLSLAGVIFSHNLTAFLVTPFIFLVFVLLLIASWRKKMFISIYYLSGGLFLGGLLSAFYSLPALLEMKFTNVASVLGGGSNPLDHFVCPVQLWQSPWGYGGSVPGCTDGLSFMLGKIHILFVLLGLAALGYLLKRKFSQEFLVMVVTFISFIFSIFMMLPSSTFIWQSIPQLAYVQFPWRFLSLTSLSIAVIAGGVVYVLARVRYTASVVVVLLSIALSIAVYTKYFTPQFYDLDIKKYEDISRITWDVSRISDEYLPKGILKPSSKDEVPKSFVDPVSAQLRVDKTVLKTQLKVVDLTSTSGLIRLNLASFPGWQIKLDHKIIVPKVVNSMYELYLSNGRHLIEARYIQTPIEKAANVLSIIGLSFLIIGIIRARKSRNL